MTKKNGNGLVMKLGTAIVVVSILVGAVLWVVDGISDAKADAGRANIRVDGVEKQLERIEAVQLRQDTKLDHILLEVRK